MNDRGMRDLMRKAQADIEAVDEQFRHTHVGMPVTVTIADFAEFGSNLALPEEGLHPYAEMVALGEPLGILRA